ncbi:MAG: (Fe-S)-binding protein [Dehalococcoidia bacterium]
MLNENLIANIRESGMAQGAKQVEERDRLLREEFGFRVVGSAEYALTTGCFNPWLEPEDLRAFRKLLDYFKVDYTLLPGERCCGSMLFHQAIDGGDNGDMQLASELAEEFLEENLRQARGAGAKKLINYCCACESVYMRFQHLVPEEILWQATLLERLFEGGKLHLQAHYYEGCHHYKHAMHSLPDLEASVNLMNRIEGLEIDYLDSSLCCLKEDELGNLAAGIKYDTIITPCGGCALYLRKALKDTDHVKVVAPTRIVWAAVSGENL